MTSRPAHYNFAFCTVREIRALNTVSGGLYTGLHSTVASGGQESLVSNERTGAICPVRRDSRTAQLHDSTVHSESTNGALLLIFFLHRMGTGWHTMSP